jgi:magnesium and cobalt transporter
MARKTTRMRYPARGPGFWPGSSAPPPRTQRIASTERPTDKGVPNGTGTRAVGLSNLRRLRVEDVAIPRAEIVSVPCDISLPELLETFREQRPDAAAGL